MRKLAVFLLILFGFCISESQAALKLTFPDGWANLVIGSDTLITWEGIPASDTVTLEYSIDYGVSWKLISDKATGLKYLWQNIPGPKSNDCFVRIQQNGDYDPSSTAPPIQWQKTYGGSEQDEATSVQQTKDGGYIVAGWTASTDGDITENKGINDAWLLKLNKFGNIEWQKTYGSSMSDAARSIIQTRDGGYIFTASAAAVDGDVSARDSCLVIWVVKLDTLGKIEWEKSFGDSQWNRSFDIKQTSDDGYIVCGDKHMEHVSWVIKLDKFGNKEWDKTYTTTYGNAAGSIIQTSEGGYIIAGDVASMDPKILDYLITKIDRLGNIEWQKSFGGWADDRLPYIEQTADGAYIVVGTSMSIGDQVVENHGQEDLWLFKMDKLGEIIWQKSYGGSLRDDANSIQQIAEGGYIVSGSTMSNDGDVVGNNGYFDFWLIKIDNYGAIEWQKAIGGRNHDILGSSQQTADGGTIMAGWTYSDNIPGCKIKGKWDMYIVKVGPKVQNDISDREFSIIAPQASSNDIDMKSCIVGNVKDSTITNFMGNTGKVKFRVDSIYFSGADKDAFKLVTPLPKYNLAPGEYESTNFEFMPNRLGLHRATIHIITQSDTLVRNITGNGILKLMVSINTDSAYAGEIKNFKLTMSMVKPEVLAIYAPKFSAKIRFQKTILTALKKIDRNVVNDSIYMNIDGSIGKLNELANFYVVAGLGTVEETTIDIVDFVLYNDFGDTIDIDVITEGGLFKLRGICKEGGTRLINPTGRAEITDILPNPARDNIEIRINLLEKGKTSLSVIDLDGIKIKEFNIMGETGARRITFDAKEFANGIYYIQLQTPTVLENKKLIIIK